MHQKGERQHGQHRHRQGDDGGKAQGHLAQPEGLVGVVGRDDLGTGAQDQLCGVLQKEGDANGGDQQRDPGGVPQRGVGDLFDHDAQQRTGKDGGAHSGDRAQAQLVHDEPGHICAHHDNVAVGEVQHLGNAVDHRIAQGDQRVNAAQTDTVDQVG